MDDTKYIEGYSNKPKVIIIINNRDDSIIATVAYTPNMDMTEQVERFFALEELSYRDDEWRSMVRTIRYIY